MVTEPPKATSIRQPLVSLVNSHLAQEAMTVN
jgi:hypothetical protein